MAVSAQRPVPTLGRVVHVCVGLGPGQRPLWRAAMVCLDAEDSPTLCPRARIIPGTEFEQLPLGGEWTDLSPHLEMIGNGDGSAWAGRWRWPPRA